MQKLIRMRQRFQKPADCRRSATPQITFLVTAGPSQRLLKGICEEILRLFDENEAIGYDVVHFSEEGHARFGGEITAVHNGNVGNGQTVTE